jgi:hypothetical protein
MTTWQDTFGRKPLVSSRKQNLKRVEAEYHRISNLRNNIFDVFERVLLEASFITHIKRSENNLVIQRDDETFFMSVYTSQHDATIYVERVVSHIRVQGKLQIGKKERYYTVKFPVSHLGKLRRLALILRKKLELYDVFQVIKS